MENSKKEKLELLLKEKKSQKTQTAKVAEIVMPTGKATDSQLHPDSKEITRGEVKKMLKENFIDLQKEVNNLFSSENLLISIKQEWKSIPFADATIKKLEQETKDGWKFAFIHTDPDNNYKAKKVIFCRNLKTN